MKREQAVPFGDVRRSLGSAHRHGFTLIELMVVVLIIGILAAFAIPQYLRSVETAKADDAVALMNMVATTNRMYALDHSTPGFLSGIIDNSCNSGAACVGGAGATVCDLVYCKYLASQDFNSKTYIAAADTPAANTVCSVTTSFPGTTCANCVACVARKTASNDGVLTGAPAGSVTGVGSYGPYTGWGYGVTTAGSISSVGGAPTAISP